MASQLLSQMASGIDQFLSANAKSPQQKKARAGGHERTDSPHSHPFTAQQSQWLHKAIGGALTHFGECVDKRFQSLESKDEERAKEVEALRAQNGLLTAELNTLKGEVDSIRKSVADVGAKLDSLPPPVAPPLPGSPAGSSTTSSSARASAAATPYELRTIARIGSLGWNTQGDVLTQRAKELLTAAGVPDTNFAGLTPASNRPGSSVELVFLTPQMLQCARLAIRQLARCWVEGKPAWLDAKKERSEMRPARMTHRAHESVVDLCSDHGVDLQGAEITKNVRGKFLEHKGRRVGFCIAGQWRWSEYGRTLVPREILDMALAYAEEE